MLSRPIRRLPLARRAVLERALVSALAPAPRSPQITGPPPDVPPTHDAHSSFESPTSTPLPNPTPLKHFTPLPSLNIPRSKWPRPTHSMGDAMDRGPVYVPGSEKDRVERHSRMSSPLRRGAHESWWTSEEGWFNAVAPVSARGDRPAHPPACSRPDHPHVPCP